LSRSVVHDKNKDNTDEPTRAAQFAIASDGRRVRTVGRTSETAEQTRLFPLDIRRGKSFVAAHRLAPFYASLTIRHGFRRCRSSMSSANVSRRRTRKPPRDNHQHDNNMLRPRSVNAAADDGTKGNRDRVDSTTNGHDCTTNIFYLAIAFCCDARYLFYLMHV
jgi:hypothetical protein